MKSIRIDEATIMSNYDIATDTEARSKVHLVFKNCSSPLVVTTAMKPEDFIEVFNAAKKTVTVSTGKRSYIHFVKKDVVFYSVEAA